MKHTAQPVKLVVLLAAVFLFGCPNKNRVPDKQVGPDGSMEPMQMVMFNYSFYPETLNVPAGKDVIFTNRDTERHCLAIEGLSIAEDIEPNETFTYVFKAPGEYEVRSTCDPARMAAKIVVK